MSDTMQAAHNVATYEDEGFVVVEMDPDTVDEYGEENALRIVGTHPWVKQQGLPVLLAWVDDEEELQVYGNVDVTSAAEELGLEYDTIPWSHEITVDWPEADEDDEDEDDDEDEEDDEDEDDDEEDSDEEEDNEPTAVKPSPVAKPGAAKPGAAKPAAAKPAAAKPAAAKPAAAKPAAPATKKKQ